MSPDDRMRQMIADDPKKTRDEKIEYLAQRIRNRTPLCQADSRALDWATFADASMICALLSDREPKGDS